MTLKTLLLMMMVMLMMVRKMMTMMAILMMKEITDHILAALVDVLFFLSLCGVWKLSRPYVEHYRKTHGRISGFEIHMNSLCSEPYKAFRRVGGTHYGLRLLVDACRDKVENSEWHECPPVPP